MIKEIKKVIDRYRTDHFIAARNILIGKESKRWINERYFITEAIDKPGTILDPSCGTGALLHSLTDWTGFSLIPYGCDVDPFAIEQSNLLFPDRKNNFRLGNFTDLHIQFPSCDYVYFNVFTNMFFDNDSDIYWILKLIDSCDRRLIFGIYGDVSPKEIAIKKRRIERILTENGFQSSVGFIGDRRKNYEGFYFDRIIK